MEKDNGDFTVDSLDFTTFQVPHHKLHPSAFRYNNFAYVTDWEYMPTNGLEKLHNLDLLIIECNDGLSQESKGHAYLDKVKQLVNAINPKKVVLTHLSWRIDYEEFKQYLPSNFELAFDGMKIYL